ncbi:1-deoxy-D-xylulose-5-phosphate reductoisomerase [Jatrophihabitans sp. YIM 134969]
MTDQRRRVVLLGSTGSVGTQTLEVARLAPERVDVVAVAAGGSRPSSVETLAEQAAEFGVEAVGLANEDHREALVDALRVRFDGRPLPEVVTGPTAVQELAARDAHTVLNAVAGSLGLRATLAAIDAGSTVALANKESLIAGGPLVTAAAKPGQLVPVDSEHSALAQCLRSGSAGEVARLVVTASGGPFRGRTREQLRDVTPAEALAHPTWDMGKLITTNSATLVNKALEVIEARLLFDVDYDRIDVVVHPQSVVHSMVTFVDGATIAQASPPDMRLPIALALGWPDRIEGAAGPVDWTVASSWTFEPLDETTFPAIALGRRAGLAGGCAPAVYNAANEELVDAFHDGRLPFLGIVDSIGTVVEQWLSEHGGGGGNPRTVEDVEEAEQWARARARSLLV